MGVWGWVGGVFVCVCVGGRKRGVSPSVEIPKDYIDHIHQADNANFASGMDLRNPQEATEPTECLMETEPPEIVSFGRNRSIDLKA